MPNTPSASALVSTERNNLGMTPRERWMLQQIREMQNQHRRIMEAAVRQANDYQSDLLNCLDEQSKLCDQWCSTALKNETRLAACHIQVRSLQLELDALKYGTGLNDMEHTLSQAVAHIQQTQSAAVVPPAAPTPPPVGGREEHVHQQKQNAATQMPDSASLSREQGFRGHGERLWWEGSEG